MRELHALLFLFPFFFLISFVNAPASSADPSLQEQDLLTSELVSLIDNQLKAIQLGHIDEAYNDYFSADFRKTTTLEQFKKFIKNYSMLANNRSFLIQSFHFQDHTAIFQGLLISTIGEETAVEYDLVNEEGKWKILGLQLFNFETTIPRPDKNK